MENTNNSSNEGRIHITQPKPVGEWKIGDRDYFISFALTKKPNPIRRFFAWAFFGLRWIDFPQPKDVSEIKPSKGLRKGITKFIQPSRRVKGAHRQ
jgi:hypothetical protein